MDRRIRILLDFASPGEAARVLSASLVRADDEELPIVCKALVKLNQPAGLAAVISRVHRLGTQFLRFLLLPGVRLDEAIVLVRQRGSAAGVLGAITVIEASLDPQLAHHAAGLLESTVDDVPARAGAALLHMVTEQFGVTGMCGAEHMGGVGHLDSAIAQALEGYRRHRNDACLLAAGIMSRRLGPRLAEVFSQPDHPAVLGLRRIARQVDEPLVRRNLIGWLGVESLAPQVVRCLDQVRAPAHREEVLKDRHLLLLPRRRRALAKVDRPARCLPAAREMEAMSQAAQAAMVDLMVAMRVPAARQVDLLREMMRLPSPWVRLKVAMAFAAHVSEEAALAEESLVFDPDDAVARTAITNITARGRATGRAFGSTFLVRLEREGGAVASLFAASHLAGRGANDFFQRWLALDDAPRLKAAIGALECDRAGMIEGLRRSIGDGGRAEAVAGLVLARRLTLGTELRPEIMARAADDDARIASAAVAAVGGIRRIPLAASHQAVEHEAMRVLERGLSHKDARVRANAIESIERHPEAPVIELVLPLATSRENRPRANATLALLRRRRELGVERLRAMLADADPLHRISAVWAARRGRAVEAEWELAVLAEDDPAPEVRVRAASARRLLMNVTMEAQQ